MRRLSHKQRKQLICLTAASGSIPCLEILLPIAGCALDPDVLAAAAAAGHRPMCQWLLDHGCPWHPELCDDKVLEAVGRSGNKDLCEWLIDVGCTKDDGWLDVAQIPALASNAAQGAAVAGHVGLMDQILADYGPPEDRGLLLAAVASGCDLPTLRRLHAVLVTDEGRRLARWSVDNMMVAAVSSATPDWRDKVEWLLAQGYARSFIASVHAARQRDALDRLTWLAALGWPAEPTQMAIEAAKRGDVAALDFALAARRGSGEGGGGGAGGAPSRDVQERVVAAAAAAGQVATLQHLQVRGWGVQAACEAAAAQGHLHVVAWAAEARSAETDTERETGEGVLCERVFVAAARSSSLPLLAWLAGRGCVCTEARVVGGALEEGASEEALEWLLAQGCELELRPEHWDGAARRGDLATLAWLRARGWAWADDGSTLTEAVAARWPLPALRWLAGAGCAADWAGALRAAREPGSQAEVAAWLEGRQE